MLKLFFDWYFIEDCPTYVKHFINLQLFLYYFRDYVMYLKRHLIIVFGIV